MIAELVLWIAPLAMPAKVRSMTLAEMVRDADAIVVACVAEIVEWPLAGRSSPEAWRPRGSARLGVV